VAETSHSGCKPELSKPDTIVLMLKVAPNEELFEVGIENGMKELTAWAFAHEEHLCSR
jgi:hypothetical protein